MRQAVGRLARRGEPFEFRAAATRGSRSCAQPRYSPETLMFRSSRFGVLGFRVEGFLGLGFWPESESSSSSHLRLRSLNAIEVCLKVVKMLFAVWSLAGTFDNVTAKQCQELRCQFQFGAPGQGYSKGQLGAVELAVQRQSVFSHITSRSRMPACHFAAERIPKADLLQDVSSLPPDVPEAFCNGNSTCNSFSYCGSSCYLKQAGPEQLGSRHCLNRVLMFRV